MFFVSGGANGRAALPLRRHARAGSLRDIMSERKVELEHFEEIILKLKDICGSYVTLVEKMAVFQAGSQQEG